MADQIIDINVTQNLDNVSLNITPNVIEINVIEGQGVVWGNISGTLSNQTDLQSALDAKANDNAVVKLTGNQTISGNKEFLNDVGVTGQITAGEAYVYGSLTTENGSVTSNSFVKFGGTSSQFLKADGSVSTAITGTLTTNYLPKATGSTTLGNSLIYDNGTNVGIGTTAPASKFHLSFTSDNDGLRIQNSNRGHSYLLSTAGGSAEFFSLYDVENSQYLYFAGNTGHSWNTAGSERMRITLGGNVGIGTTAPTSKLQVVGLPSYADNTTALAGGLTVGAFYHTAGVLKVVI